MRIYIGLFHTFMVVLHEEIQKQYVIIYYMSVLFIFLMLNNLGFHTMCTIHTYKQTNKRQANEHLILIAVPLTQVFRRISFFL